MKLFSKISVLIVILGLTSLNAQQENNPNVILITLDGVRWQDVFTGIDTTLLNSSYTQDKGLLTEKYRGTSLDENRKLLMPFFWNTIAIEGQLHGNRLKGSKVDLTNKMMFSYPGYNEILTGRSDDKNINSNDKIYNLNKTILETANESNAYQGKVAAFGSWDVFPYILNDKRSGIPVNAGYTEAKGNLSDRERFLNELQRQAPIIWESVRLDVFTHHFAMEYMKKNHPKLVYIGYGETDDFAHGGFFDLYMKSLQNTDALIADLWDYLQGDPFYKDTTYILITTDHGRGIGIAKDSKWTDHGIDVQGAQETWLAILGPGLDGSGEAINNQIFTNQIAPTILGLLNLNEDVKDLPSKKIILK